MKKERECIKILEREGYLAKEVSENLIKAIGLRNLLIHEYIKIDPERLLGFLDEIEYFERFIQDIGRILKIDEG